MVDNVKDNKELDIEYMKIFEREQMLREEGRLEGRLEGKLEGRLEGRLEIIKNHIDCGHSINEIASALLMPVSEIQVLVEKIDHEKAEK